MSLFRQIIAIALCLGTMEQAVLGSGLPTVHSRPCSAESFLVLSSARFDEQALQSGLIQAFTTFKGAASRLRQNEGLIYKVFAPAALALFFAPLLDHRTLTEVPGDFLMYYSGPKLLFFHHINPQVFSPALADTLQNIFASWGLNSQEVSSLLYRYQLNGGYWNSPINLILFAPLALFTHWTAYFIFELAALLSLLTSVNLLAWRLAKGSTWTEKLPTLVGATIISSQFWPLQQSLRIGQIEFAYFLPLAVALFLFSSASQRLARSHLGAALIDLSAAIKAYPVIFIAPFFVWHLDDLWSLLKRRPQGLLREYGRLLSTKTISRIFLWGIAGIGFTGLLIGFDSWTIWLSKWKSISTEVVSLPRDLSRYVWATVRSITGNDSGPLASAITNALRLALAWPVLKVWRNGHSSPQNILLNAALAASFMPILLPRVTTYFYALLLMPVICGWLLAAELPGRKRIFSRSLLGLGYVLSQGLQNYPLEIEPLLAQALRSLFGFLWMPLPDSLGAFGFPYAPNVLQGDPLVFPGAVMLFVAMLIIANGLGPRDLGSHKNAVLPAA